MRLYNCVMLLLDNPRLQLIHRDLLDNYSQYIDYDYIMENCKSWRSVVESTPHITIIYGLEPGIGKNALYHTVKIKNRDEYKAIRGKDFINLPNPVINTFDNDGHRVLKVDFDECDLYNELNALSEKLTEIPNTWQYKGNYHPHCTLTYFKGNTPDSVIQELSDKFSDVLKQFGIKEFMISSDDDSVPNEFFM